MAGKISRRRQSRILEQDFRSAIREGNTLTSGVYFAHDPAGGQLPERIAKT
jgi:hypothetical protein